MRAIDFYAGIGGWSLGLRLAGIDVVDSFEWWQPAIDTHNGNHATTLEVTDIRKLDYSKLPKNIDIVVGSPPCTQFSYANRGGSGNQQDGMIDLVRFFGAVEVVKPKFWAMENVPRVAKVLEVGFSEPEHPLYRFRKLNPNIEVLNFSDFGTPQIRRRCVATNLDFKDIRAFAKKVNAPNLGEAINAFEANPDIVDPVWGTSIPANQLTEMEKEPFLNEEELRMNREAKTYHPVYNNMAFPDRLMTPSRTVTATCTRVSRESIVVEDSTESGEYRRLTIRERASLQGFPITYQFYGKSFAEKAKMIGNAIPPNFTYLLALVAKGESPSKWSGFEAVGKSLSRPEKLSKKTEPDKEGRTYPNRRKFRAALPHLRFKSGMRFDLSNSFDGEVCSWTVNFYYGNSKKIGSHTPNKQSNISLQRVRGVKAVIGELDSSFSKLEKKLSSSEPRKLQDVWAHKDKGLGPFEVVDLLGHLVSATYIGIGNILEDAESAELVFSLLSQTNPEPEIIGSKKIRTNAAWILCGMIVGEWFNELTWHKILRLAA